MKKYTKQEMKTARAQFGRLTEAMMMAHNERVDEARAEKKKSK